MSENTLKEVEIFGVGEWQGQNMKKPFKFTMEMVRKIVANTMKVENKISMPIKLGHTNKQIFNQTDGQPALGWLKNVKLKGEKIVADLTNIPEVLMKAMKKGLFKQVSVEIGNTKSVGPHVTALAVLGADLPAVKSLKDLDQYFSEKNDLDDCEVQLCFAQPKFDKEEIMPETTEFDFEARFAEREAELKAKENALKVKEEKLKQDALEGLFSSQKESIVAEFKAQVEEGKLMPHMLTKIEADLDGQKIGFSETSQLSLSFSTIKELSSSYSKLPEGEKLEQEGEQKDMSISDRLDKKVFSVMENTGKSYGEAWELVFSANKDLSEEYLKSAMNEYTGGQYGRI